MIKESKLIYFYDTEDMNSKNILLLKINFVEINVLFGTYCKKII